MNHNRIHTIIRRAEALLTAPSHTRLMRIHKVLGRIVNSGQYVSGPISKAHELLSKTHALLHTVRT